MPVKTSLKAGTDTTRTTWILKLLLLLVVLLFAVNTLVLAVLTGYVKLPQRALPLEAARRGGELVVEYSQRLARDLGVGDNQAVRAILAKFKFELEQAASPEAVAQVILRYGRETQDTILREQENLRREEVLAIIRQEPRLAGMLGEATITVARSEERGIEVDDPARLLSPETIQKIKESKSLARLGQVVEVKVRDGRADLVTPVSVLERLKHAESEAENLRARLQEVRAKAGFAPLSGSGIIVRLYDAEGGAGTGEIVHDFDVRDVVNELFAAGATGIAVNNQRLVATSSIRCAGPVILVNQKPIAVNPVTIFALGDQEVLASSLDLLRAEFEASGLRLEIERADDITLPGYEENAGN
ncbi:MAG: hypothetical protein PWQ86_1020 [Bacillota bacterium]|nr:hypothetical protein [Bacillota bacterium]